MIIWCASQFAFLPNEAARGVATLYYSTTNAPYKEPYLIATTNLAERSAWTNGPSPYHRLVDGVVSLSVLAYDRDGELLPGTNAVTEDYLFSQDQLSYTFLNSNLPAAVELELGILEQETLDQLRAVAGPDLANHTALTNYLATRPETVHIFRQRIALRAQNRIVP